MIFRKLLKTVVPHRWLVATRFALRPEIASVPLVAAPSVAELLQRLMQSYGYGRAISDNAPVDASGSPVPWYTYPMIEYLDSIDFSDMTVFEYGCGNSTLWWSARARHVISIEDDPAWYERVSKQMRVNTQVLLETDVTRYVESIRQFGEFDVIIVDASVRYACAIEAVRHLKPGGAIIVDNSNCLPESTRFLRDSGLFEVAMNGFTPLLKHASRTSLFLSQPCRLKLRPDHRTWGGMDENWDAKQMAAAQSAIQSVTAK